MAEETLGKAPEQTREENSILDAKLSRRELLTLAGIAAGSAMLGKATKQQKRAQETLFTSEFLNPYEVHGVEVFGLIDPIADETQILTLYEKADRDFASKAGMNPITRLSYPKRELRKEYLPPHERFLEIVVTRSAYNAYLQEANKETPDFIEWIQAHVNCLNTLLENTKPPSIMRANLRRVVIIEDELANQYYDRNNAHVLEGAFDWKWKSKFTRNGVDKFPIDTDCSWAIANVPNTNPAEIPYLWDYALDEERIYFGFPSGSENYAQGYSYPLSLQTPNSRLRKGVIDFALIHEWSHRLLNLPDEYGFDYTDEIYNTSFTFSTGLLFEPRISPYLAMLTNDHVRNRRRPSLQDHFGKGYGAFEIPEQMYLSFTGETPDVPYTAGILGKNLGGIETVDYRTQESFLALSPEIGTKKSKDARLIHMQRGENSVFIPYALFNMSKMAGEEHARYIIEINAKIKWDETGARHQSLELVDESDVGMFLENKKRQEQSYYAKMKIDGTNTWAFWSEN